VKNILYLFAWLSGLGLVLSFLSHVAALLGRQGPLGALTMSLHAGVFVVWIPAVLAMNRLTKGTSRKNFWKAAFRGCPAWMKYMAYGFFGYAFLNFALFISTAPQGRSAGPIQPAVVRGFSGHWMAFYSIALAGLYSAAKLWDRDLDVRCPVGHVVQPSAQFCDQCGLPVVSTGRGRDPL